MIKDKTMARKAMCFHQAYVKQLTDHMREMQGVLPEDEFRSYCAKSGKVIYKIMEEFINELSLAHPELKPEGFEAVRGKQDGI